MFAFVFPITVDCFGCVNWGDGCSDYSGEGRGSEACGEYTHQQPPILLGRINTKTEIMEGLSS